MRSKGATSFRVATILEIFIGSSTPDALYDGIRESYVHTARSFNRAYLHNAIVIVVWATIHYKIIKVNICLKTLNKKSINFQI